MIATQRLGASARPCSLRPAAKRPALATLRPRCCVFARPSVVVVAHAGVSPPPPAPREERAGSNGMGSFGSSGAMPMPSSSMGAPFMMARGGDMGSGGSLSQTMERQPLQFVMPTPTVQGPKLDDGSGGDSGNKHNHNGGGGGDGGGDDDDDFFAGDDGDGEGGGGGGKAYENSFLRTLIPESYDKLSIAAVFAEWMRTVGDLPLILRRAVEMGLFSSAQLVRFFAMDVRPGLARSVSRSLPPSWARDFVGRLMADPAFAQKLVLESTFAACASLYYEFRLRGERFQKELDLALINSVGMAAATAATVWLLAPTRSYGSVHKFPWQQMLDGLPNCVFDASGPLRHYTREARVGAFFAKMAELSAVGAVTGAATSLASSAAVELHRRTDPSYGEPSTSVPDVGRSSGGLATFFAANANIRYQLIGGLDRYLFAHTNFLWTYLGITGLARLASISVGELSRPWWQGLPTHGSLDARKPVVRTRRVSKKVSRKVPKASVASAVQQQAAVASVASVAPEAAFEGASSSSGVAAWDGSAEPAAASAAAGFAEAVPSAVHASHSGLDVNEAAAASHSQGQAADRPQQPEVSGGSSGASEQYVLAASQPLQHSAGPWLDGSHQGAGSQVA